MMPKKKPLRSMEQDPVFEPVGKVVRTERTDDSTTVVWRKEKLSPEPPVQPSST